MTTPPAREPSGAIDPRPLAGQTALVTGATRGLGRVIAEWLGRAGAAIVVSGREHDAVEASVTAIQALGVDALGVPADLSRIEDAHGLARETLDRVPRLDILVNNAGMSRRGPFWEVTDDEWDEQVTVNWRAPFVLCQHFARHAIGRGGGGRIVNVSTIGAHAAHKNGLVYDAAKAAVEAMTRNLAYELAPHRVGVNCVIPGNIADRPGAEAHADRWSDWAREIPAGRVGRAEDIAAAVRFFCLPETEWTTGQSLLVDGGHLTFLRE